MRSYVITIAVWLLLSVLLAGTLGADPQRRSADEQEKTRRKPVLIRDDQTRDPVKTEEEVFALDPEKARENFEIGQFYLKRKHYDAALMRFRDAIKYDPTFQAAKWMFIHTLAEKKDWANLVSFARAYLEADDIPDYEKQIREALQKAEKNLPEMNPKKRP